MNVSPFHSVNSPLVDPVKIRRHSGVHYSGDNKALQGKFRNKWLRGAHHDTIHRTTDLVCRRVDELGAQRRRRVSRVGFRRKELKNRWADSTIYSVKYWYRYIGSKGLHTSIIYGSAGLMYGKYRGLDKDLRN